MITTFNITALKRDLLKIEREVYPMTAGGKVATEICQPLMAAIVNAGSPLSHLWSVSPRYGQLILVGHATNDGSKYGIPRTSVMETASCFTGKSVSSRRCEYFPRLDLRDGDRVFADSQLAQRLDLRSLIAIPIPNIGNPHQTLFVLSLFLGCGGVPSDAVIEELMTALQDHAQLLADAIESNLRERCFRASMAVSQAMGKLSVLTRKSAYAKLAEIVASAIDASETTVYTENWSGLSIEPQSQLTKERRHKEALLERDSNFESAVSDVWRKNRESLSISVPREESNDPCSSLFVPLHDIKGKCRGVIRCVKFAEKKPRRLFTYDDVAILEAMEQAFGPSFEMLLAAERREISVQKLAHELRVPIAAFNAILERMQRECEGKGFVFRFNHFNEAKNYVDLMNRLSKELDFVRKGPSEAVLVFQETRLESGVVAPAIRFIAPLIRKRGFRRDQVTFRELEFLPPVMIDGPFISQVLFNLLENAIKYFPKTRRPADFKCLVEGKLLGNFVEIHVTDNGHPIPEQERERVFEFGFRGDHAKSIDSDGAGLGLWISRAVVERHGGFLELRIDSNDKNVFVIRLPGPEPRPQVSRRMPHIRT